MNEPNMNRKPAEPAIQETHEDGITPDMKLLARLRACRFSSVPFELMREAADRIESLTRARDEVIEQCAKVCDNLGDGGGMVRDKWGDRQASVTDCATAIRALKHSGADKP